MRLFLRHHPSLVAVVLWRKGCDIFVFFLFGTRQIFLWFVDFQIRVLRKQYLSFKTYFVRSITSKKLVEFIASSWYFDNVFSTCWKFLCRDKPKALSGIFYKKYSFSKIKKLHPFFIANRKFMIRHLRRINRSSNNRIWKFR